jgi:hypothetical protein
VQQNAFFKTFALILLVLFAEPCGSLFAAFPATQEKADLTLHFALSPTDPSGTGSGTGSIHLKRLAGVEYRDPLQLTLSGLASGTYSVGAIKKSGPLTPPVLIGSIVVSADPSSPPPLPLPEGVAALDIAMLTITDSTDTVILSGEPAEDIVKWRFVGERPLRGPSIPPTALPPAIAALIATSVHGYVSIQAKIVNNTDLRRTFLLVGRGLPPSAPLTLNLDGVAVKEVRTNSLGNLALSSLNGDFRIAGTHLLTLTDRNTNVIAQADFFPGAD